MKKKYVFIYFGLHIFPGVIAQIPPGYYERAAGKTGTALQQALHDIIQTTISVDYSTLWTCFETTDKKPDNTVWDIYSDIPGAGPPYSYQFGTDQCGSAGGASAEDVCYDREHSWPKSWFGGEIYPMYSDLFILYPADSYVNGRRLNYPYGTVDQPQWTSLNGSKLGNCGWPGYTGKVFEPIDEYKGDLARSYFYMTVRYYQDDNGWPGSAMNTGSQLKTWALALLKYWNSLDPVSQKEIGRNNAVFAIQRNRNPFIDHPEYATLIWGNGMGIEGNGNRDRTIRIFPNPSHDYCHLVSEGSGELAGISIVSMTGLPVNVSATNEERGLLLDIKDLATGIYFVTLSGPGDSGCYVGKIVKD
jgi:endonuclease I